MTKDIGYVIVEIPAMLVGMAGLTVCTSKGTGPLNTKVPAFVGEENISISGKFQLNNELFKLDLKIPVVITKNCITRLSMPYLDLLKNIGV